MKKIPYFLIIFILSCHSVPTNHLALKKDSAPKKSDSLLTAHTFSDTILQNKIADTLLKLSFIKNANNYIDSFSNHTHGIAFLMDSSHEEGEKDQVVVTAGFNDTDMFKTYYTIFVNSKTLEIKILDGLNDRKLSLEEFEKNHK